jgi:RNA polymerase sigma factor (sigma-70 family)
MQLTYRELTENYLETRSEKDFTVLYRKVKPGLRSYIYKIIKDQEATDDVLVNTLAKMWTKIDQFDPQYQITTWLYRIAFNECLGFINERNKKTSLNKLSEFGIEVEDGGTINDDLSILLEDAEYKTEQDFLDEDQELENQYLQCLQQIQNLKPLYREIVIDRLINGMKYEDISAKYDLPLQTIKNRILRGKRIIIDQIENNETE